MPTGGVGFLYSVKVHRGAIFEHGDPKRATVAPIGRFDRVRFPIGARAVFDARGARGARVDVVVPIDNLLRTPVVIHSVKFSDS